MQTNNSAVSWIIVLVIGIIALTFLASGNFSQTDLMNPHTSRAEAVEKQQQADLEYRRGLVELATYPEVARLEADIYKEELVLNFEQRQQQAEQAAYAAAVQQAQEAQTREMMVKIAYIGGIFAVVLVLITLTYFAMLVIQHHFGRGRAARTAATRVDRPPTNPAGHDSRPEYDP